jgi:tetratricopeptide (TPR) repeat protein
MKHASRSALVFTLAVNVGLGLPLVRAEAAPAGGPQAPMDQARDRFAKGVQLYHEGSFEAALAEFQKAYQLAPSYRLHYNIAQVYYELHNYVEALRAFWKYLAQGGNEIPADRKAKVQAEMQKLESRVCYLTIKTNVHGAQITLDDAPVGIAPLRSPVLVNPGLRRVGATRPGYLPVALSVTAAGGERLEVNLPLADAVGHPGLVGHAGALPVGGLGLAATDTGTAGPTRSKTWISLATAGVLASGTLVLGLLARDAKGEFETELARVPNTKAGIEDARTRMVRYAALTDAVGAAALMATGVTVYFALTEGRPRLTSAVAGGAPRDPRRPGVSLSASPGGLRLDGRF